MTDTATECDKCYGPIPFNETCYFIPTGARDSEYDAPVGRIVCAQCYRSERSR